MKLDNEYYRSHVECPYVGQLITSALTNNICMIVSINRVPDTCVGFVAGQHKFMIFDVITKRMMEIHSWKKDLLSGFRHWTH